jgi:hypothetical protein
LRVSSKLTIALLGAALTSAQNPSQQLAHFHLVQLNVTDPAAAVAFYTSKFDSEKPAFWGWKRFGRKNHGFCSPRLQRPRLK